MKTKNTIKTVLAVFVSALLFPARCQPQDVLASTGPKNVTYLGPNQNQCHWHAKQIVLHSSGGSALRGVWVSRIEKTMMATRREVITVIETIDVKGPIRNENDFSEEFEEETASEEFLTKVENYGASIAAKANFESSFFSAEAGLSLSKETQSTVNQVAKENRKYYSSIKCSNVPIKSVDLDPFYIRINQAALEKLSRIENKLNISIEDKNVEFKDFFYMFGSHVLWGSFEFGGTIIVKAETSIDSNSQYEDIKEVVKSSAAAYMKASATGSGMSGGAEVHVNEQSVKDKLSKTYNSETLKKIKLSMEKKGGSPGDNEIPKWKEGLAAKSDTWKVIGKPTQFLPIWEIITLHHRDEFVNAENLATLMEEEWKNITKTDYEKEMSTLPSEFNELGSQRTTAIKRKEALIAVLNQREVGANKGNKIAHFSVIPGVGKLLMSSLKYEPMVAGRTYLKYENVLHIPLKPPQIYMKIHNNNGYVGHVIITLDGYNNYPKKVQQLLDLMTGDNPVGGTWTGARAKSINNPGMTGENIGWYGYVGPNGQELHKPLYGVERLGRYTQWRAGQVRGHTAISQGSGFSIFTRDENHPSNSPVLGRVTSGLDILQTAARRGLDYVKSLTFKETGIVVFG